MVFIISFVPQVMRSSEFVSGVEVGSARFPRVRQWVSRLTRESISSRTRDPTKLLLK